MLLEANISTFLPETICVRDPFGNITEQIVYCEWVPYYRTKCKRLGHEEVSCSSQPIRSIWVSKPKATPEGPNQPEPVTDTGPPIAVTDQHHKEASTPVHEVVTNAPSPGLKCGAKKTISFSDRL